MISGNSIKIVWLCHFSNDEIQEFLKPYKRIGEIAPWIAALAKLIEDHNDIELHIVSPHEYICGNKQFRFRGAHYHFFNAHIPFWGRHWPGFFKFDDWTDFFLTKLKVRKIVNKIKPDVLHLHGPENAYFASSIFQFRLKYPVLITIQGFISNTFGKKNSQIRMRVQCEKEILEKFKHFGYRTKTMGQEIKKFNANAKLHWHHYPFVEVTPVIQEKKYDLVFFARIAKDKGVEDLLKALKLIKKDKPDVTLLIIGGANKSYLNFLNELTFEYKLNENVNWAGFLPTQEDVHRLASASRISVLPTYNDIISGTIIESLFLGLPVVAYDVGSIYEVNEKEEIISLVKKGDINMLADSIMELLKNDKLIVELGKKGIMRAKEMFSNQTIKTDLIKAYMEVINEYKHENSIGYRS